MEHTTLTEKQLRKLCKRWQKRLRLQDWTVAVHICRERDFNGEGNAGECTVHRPCKEAVIRILDPVDLTPNPQWPRAEHDMEHVLVHELLHLHFDALGINCKNADKYHAMEQTVDTLAWSLVNAYRG